MTKRAYPVPCVRENATGWIFEIPAGVQTPFTTRDEALDHALEVGAHRKYGKLFAQAPGTLKFEQVAEDDGLYEDLE
jgi:hypothetical protein